jgi:hypothetical protein
VSSKWTKTHSSGVLNEGLYIISIKYPRRKAVKQQIGTLQASPHHTPNYQITTATPAPRTSGHSGLDGGGIQANKPTTNSQTTQITANYPAVIPRDNASKNSKSLPTQSPNKQTNKQINRIKMKTSSRGFSPPSKLCWESVLSLWWTEIFFAQFDLCDLSFRSLPSFDEDEGLQMRY